jgi:NAD(P)-dependent dehydrogenase (short-subunit alcohol dehydrogenase family)
MSNSAPTRITSAFGARTTALEAIKGITLTGRNAIVTGGASGLGLETSRALASAGAALTLAVRNLAQGQAAADVLRAEVPAAQVSVGLLDLSDLASVRDFAADWMLPGSPLDILINNAAIMACPLTRSPQGWEAQFATNHLGHFALTAALLPALQKAARKTGDARVVSLSSSGHKISGVEFDDIHFERRE